MKQGHERRLEPGLVEEFEGTERSHPRRMLADLSQSQHRRHFWKDDFEQTAFCTELDRTAAIAVHQHSLELLRDAFGTDDGELSRHLLNSGACAVFQCEVECRRKPHGPQKSQLVFHHAFVRVADRTDDAVSKVLLTADVVDHLFRQRIEEHPVDREIAALGIRFRIGERDAFGPPSIEVTPLCAESCDFNGKHTGVAFRLRRQDNDHAKARADSERAAVTEQITHVIGQGGSRDVEVLRLTSEKEIPNTTAGE